jgi:hypothetical protein
MNEESDMNAATLIEILAQHIATHPQGAAAPVYIGGHDPQPAARCYDLGDGRPLYIVTDAPRYGLTAAAPAMLAALQEILADQETMHEPYRNEAICERIRAAIAAATGER